MISLSPPKEPYFVNLPYGIKVKVKPLSTSTMAFAKAKAGKKLDNLVKQYQENKETGFNIEGLDLSDEALKDGLFTDLLIKELAIDHIIEWSGIEDDPPVNAENIAALMELYPIGERFFAEFTIHQALLNAAKNA